MSWKDTLLSTGLPLEYSVRRVIENLGLIGSREFSYIRNNENGFQTEFSVDVHAFQFDHMPISYWAEYLIECKYRRDGTQWIFIPEERFEDDGPSSCLSFVSLDFWSEGIRMDKNLFDSLPDYKVVAKGCEVFGNDRKAASIEQAVHQLRYAVPNCIVEALENFPHHLIGSPNPVWNILPIIVTTSELWCLKDGTTIEDIRASDELSVVAENVDQLVLHRPPDNLLKRYSKALIDNKIGVNDGAILDRLMRNNGNGMDWNWFVNRCTGDWPSHFLVVHLRAFEKTVELFSKFFSNEHLYTTRKQ
jgi:hypothetical protein